MPKGNLNPKTQHLQPKTREWDDFMELPLSSAPPISVRLPEVVRDWVKEQGSVWLRNTITQAALVEMGLLDVDEE